MRRINKASSKKGAFLLGEIMRKTSENLEKDKKRSKGKQWIDEHTYFKDRTCGSGVVFYGRYKVR